MMAVVLGILKIIGMIVLWILAILLILILLLLLWPICYDLNIEKDDKNAAARGRVWWLLHAVHAKAEFSQGKDPKVSMELYLFGIPLMSLLKKKKQEKPDPEKKDDAEAAPHRAKKQPTVSPARWKYMPGDDTKRRSENIEIQVVKRKKPSIFLRIGARISAFFGKLKSLFASAQTALEKISAWLEYLGSETFGRAKNLILKTVIRILRHILPRRIDGKLDFGLEDPSLTGQILGVIAILYPKLPGDIDITPDFAEQRLEADVRIRGHLVIGYILLKLALMILNRDVRGLLKTVKNGPAASQQTQRAA